MPHLVGDAAVNHVLDEAMPMSRHRDEVAALPFRSESDLLARIAASQQALGFDTVSFQLVADLFEIIAVGAHLFRLAQLKLIGVARGESVSDVHEKHRAAGQFRQPPHMVNDRVVRVGVLERNENALVHQLIHPCTVRTSNHPLSAAITSATIYASSL